MIAAPIRFERLDAQRIRVMEPWPEHSIMSNELMQMVQRREVHGHMHCSWPFLVIRVTNGCAVYRLSTREQGAWPIDLVDSYKDLTT